MKRAYMNKLGDIIVPFDSLDAGEVVKVTHTDTGYSDMLLVTSNSGCHECPYLSAPHNMCTARWVNEHMEVPLCITRRFNEQISFRALDNIMEGLGRMNCQELISV